MDLKTHLGFWNSLIRHYRFMQEESPQISLPVASYVALWPTVHVGGALESSVSLALLHHGGLRMGHAGRKQGALWCARTPEASVRLLAHTCGGRIKIG